MIAPIIFLAAAYDTAGSYRKRIGKEFGLLFILYAIFGNDLFAQPPVSKASRFRAAVVKIDITPRDSQMLLGYQARKSIGIHDRIYHRIIALDDGNAQFFLVSSDICLFSPSEYDRVQPN